jgi:hypothetical protein
MDPVIQALWQAGRRGRGRARRTLHVLPTVWLIGLGIANGIMALVCLASALVAAIQSGLMATLVPWLFAAWSAIGLMNVGLAVFLLLGKKWAFYGFIATFGVGFILDLAAGWLLMAGIVFIAAAVVVALTYALLQAGSPTTWSQLE